MKKIISLVLCLVLFFGAVLPLNAVAFSKDNSWSKYLSEGKGVYIAPGADDTEIYVTWYGGKEGTKPVVYVSKNENMANSIAFEGAIHSSKQVERSNHVVVTGLEKGRTYYYVCSDGTMNTEVKSFKTVADGQDFSAIYVSDIHIAGTSYDDEALYNSAKRWNDVLVEATKRQNISLILSGGDQATEARSCEYYGLMYPNQVKTIPFAMAIGNHDVKRYTFDTIANYPNTREKGFSSSLVHGDYYFVKGNALFVVLDSTNSSSADHYAFVKDAVKKNPDVKWKIMMFHHDLYGGHIESRESENELLRLLFTPIIDTFNFDLVLSGHSHCFSRSHVIYKGDIKEDLTGKTSVTDPDGTIYLTNGTLCVSENPEYTEPIIDSDRKSEFVATDYLTQTESVYNILDFTSDSLTIKSYTYGSKDAFTQFTIYKTTNEGGYSGKRAPLWFTVGKYVGTIYNIINNISRKIEIADRD